MARTRELLKKNAERSKKKKMSSTSKKVARQKETRHDEDDMNERTASQEPDNGGTAVARAMNESNTAGSTNEQTANEQSNRVRPKQKVNARPNNKGAKKNTDKEAGASAKGGEQSGEKRSKKKNGDRNGGKEPGDADGDEEGAEGMKETGEKSKNNKKKNTFKERERQRIRAKVKKAKKKILNAGGSLNEEEYTALKTKVAKEVKSISRTVENLDQLNLNPPKQPRTNPNAEKKAKAVQKEREKHNDEPNRGILPEHKAKSAEKKNEIYWQVDRQPDELVYFNGDDSLRCFWYPHYCKVKDGKIEQGTLCVKRVRASTNVGNHTAFRVPKVESFCHWRCTTRGQRYRYRFDGVNTVDPLTEVHLKLGQRNGIERRDVAWVLKDIRKTRKPGQTLLHAAIDNSHSQLAKALK
ncbi:hypothetical protein C8Q75DRAFT_811546 [Abortiporus biennis]|nr:hypothetical protein C8Q75DRAFT_811546 [Abortiporus biennis]